MHRSSQSRSNSRNNDEDVTSSLLANHSNSHGSRPNSSSRSDRQNELNAAFDSDDEQEDELDNRPDEGEVTGQANHSASNPLGNANGRNDGDRLPDYHPSNPSSNGGANRDSDRDRDVFFDAGDAMEGHEIVNHHPLQERTNETGSSDFNPVSNPSGSNHDGHGNNRSSSTYPHPHPHHQQDLSEEIDQEELSFLDPNQQSHSRQSHSNSILNSPSNPNANQNNLTKVRYFLGRFGRFVGMRVPGATYSTLSQDENESSQGVGASANANGGRRRVMGGGIGQDGVFANLNAKPERRRRVRDGAEDRGEDDDLEDSALPPTYNAAAADSAPPYWETAIIGGPGLGGLHPLAPGGMGWTPGGSHVGEIEDLIVEGLPVGNLFGFAWNLLVSVCFQFVGFLLTYLLHTTHASKCGSRAGLGFTLIQYGFYLRTRSLEEDSSSGGGNGVDVNNPNPNGSTTSSIHTWWGGDIEIETPSSSIMIENPSRRQDPTPTSSGHTTSLADLFAISADSPGAEAGVGGTSGGKTNSISESFNGSTEWLSYLLMILGWFILLSSLLSFWRVHRWGKQLVDGARRDRENNENNNETSNNAENNENLSMLERLRARISGHSRSGSNTHSAEDWLVFPGLGNRLGAFSESGNAIGSRSGYDLDLESGRINREGQEEGERHLDEGQDSRTHMSPEERRLFDDMRTVGLIG